MHRRVRWLPEHLTNSRRRTVRLGCEQLETRDNPAFVFAGAAFGSASIVTGFDSDTGNIFLQQQVFDTAFTGGVHVASADFTGDGKADLIAAAGPGGGPRVRILDAVTGNSIAGPLGDFFAFEPEFDGGVFVAIAKLDEDGIPDLIVAAGEGGGPRVRAWSGVNGSQIADFFAYAPGMMSGVVIAAADFTGDGFDDLVVAPGPGSTDLIRIFDITTGDLADSPLAEFEAFGGGSGNGFRIDTGDVNDDSVNDLIVATGTGQDSEIEVYSGADGSSLASFLTGGDSSGTQIATADVNGDAIVDIVARITINGIREVRAYDGLTYDPIALHVSFPSNLDDIEAINPKPIISIDHANESGDEESGVPVRIVITRTAEFWNLGPLVVYLDADLDPVLGAELKAAGIIPDAPFATVGKDVVFPQFTFAEGEESIEFELPIVDDPWMETDEALPVRVTPNINYDAVSEWLGFTITDTNSNDNLTEEFNTGSATLDGRAWVDAYADGKQGISDQNLSDVTVHLWQPNADEPVASTVSDSTGVYSFIISSGSPYRIEIVNPNVLMYSYTSRYATTADLDSNIDASGYSEWFSIGNGMIDSSRDAGFFRINTPAHAYDLNYSITHDTVLHGVVDYVDDDGDDVTFVLEEDAASGELLFDTQSGNFVFTPEIFFEGDVSFMYSVFDGYDSGEVKTVTIQVVNFVPYGGGDAFFVSHDRTLNGYGLIINDSDPDGDLIVASDYSQPTNGTITIFNGADGTFDYTPNASYVGEDRFSYTLSDGVDEYEVPVVINVTNYRPLGVTQAFYASEGSTIEDFVAMIDIDNDATTAVIVSGPSSGNFQFFSDGYFIYEPDYPVDSYVFSPDWFTYYVTDGVINSPTATVYLATQEANYEAIRAVGIATQIQHDTFLESSAEVAGVISFDPDPVPPVVIIIDVNPLHGTLSDWNETAFTYTPDPGYTGTDVFWYHPEQGGHVGSSAPVFLSVVNTAPVARSENYNTTQFGGELEIGVAQGVLYNDDDLDGEPMQAVLVSEPEEGELILSPDGSFVFTYPDEIFGIVEFTYKTSDGLSFSDPVTVLINVQPVILGSISDFVWVDLNGNGIQDNSEKGLPNAKVELFEYNGSASHLLMETTTDSAGWYKFTELLPADYFVRFWNRNVDQYQFTLPYIGGNPAKDSNATTYNGDQTNGTSEVITINGTDDDTIDAGFYPNGVFLVQEIDFTSDAKKVIWNDAGMVQYNNDQWYDVQPDTVPEKSDPVLFVRDKEITIDLVALVPRGSSGKSPADYNLEGTIAFTGTANIVITSSTGTESNGRWVYTNLSAGSSKYDEVGYDSTMEIVWRLVPKSGIGSTLNAGTTSNPGYLTYDPVQVIGFKLRRTLVHLGSGGEGVITPGDHVAVLNRLWEKFSTNSVKTWDNLPLIFYKEWNIVTIPETTEKLLLDRYGNCTAFGTTMIDALRAQGIEQDDDYYRIKFPLGGEEHHMFVGNWTSQNGGGANPVYPGNADLVDYKWLIASPDAGPYDAHQGWELINNVWQYTYIAIPPMLASAATPSQNNSNALGIFWRHMLVHLTVNGEHRLYDPSYGKFYSGLTAAAALAEWETSAVPYVGYINTFPAGTPNGVRLIYVVRQNPIGADAVRVTNALLNY